ncbi:MAG: hypothetical protein IPI91_16300 [Flavobacteriales bacterium]|nr:hypothetical protein [Flavobacteriales bacterium]
MVPTRGIEGGNGVEGPKPARAGKAQADARNQTAKAYFGVLAAEEGIRLIGESLPLLEKSLNEVTATFGSRFSGADRCGPDQHPVGTSSRSAAEF